MQALPETETSGALRCILRCLRSTLKLATTGDIPFLKKWRVTTPLPFLPPHGCRGNLIIIAIGTFDGDQYRRLNVYIQKQKIGPRARSQTFPCSYKILDDHYVCNQGTDGSLCLHAWYGALIVLITAIIIISI